MNYQKKRQKRDSFSHFRKRIGKDIITDTKMTDLLVVTKRGYGYEPDSISFVCASEYPEGRGEDWCIDECKSMLLLAVMDNVELRDIVLDVVDLYDRDHCLDDEIELDCYRKGRMDVWRKYCSKDRDGLKAMLDELPSELRDAINAQLAREEKEKVEPEGSGS